MPRLRRFALTAASSVVAGLLFVPAHANTAPYTSSEAQQAAHPSPTGSAGASATATASTGSISVATSAGETVMPFGVYLDAADVGLGASRGTASARMIEDILITTGGASIVTVDIENINASASASGVSPLALVAAAVNAQVTAYFFPCPGNVCTGTPTTTASSGLVPVAHTAVPFPGGPPTEVTLTTTINASGPGLVRIDTGFYARSDASGAGSAVASGTGTVTLIGLTTQPPPTSTLYDEDATQRVLAGGPTSNAQAAASADRASGALNVSTAAYESVFPAGVYVEAANIAVGAARAFAIARVMEKTAVSAGPHTVTITIGGISASGTRKLYHALGTANSAVDTRARVYFVPCPTGPPCGTVPTVEAPTAYRAIFHTAAEGVPTSVTLTRTITVPDSGTIHVDVGFYARSDASGQSITGTQASGTVTSIAVS